MRVLLGFFDTMRHDHASCYGYHRETTPNIDRLAAEGALFGNSYCTDTPTQPCYTSVLTGKRGITTGVVSHGQPEETIGRGIKTFPQVLAENGVLTAAVSTLYRFRRWFAQGFTHYVQPSIKTWLQHVTAEQVNQAAIPWLKAYAQKDFFLFLHYWDPHTPYNIVPEAYTKRFYTGDPYDPENHSFDDLRARPLINFFISGGAVPELREGLTDFEYPVAQYDAEIAYADEHFAEVLDVLEKEKVLDDTLVIFTSDHGEAMNEHGIYYDHMDAYDQVSHVPLVIWHPQRVKPAKIDALVQHIDFAPTILEAFGVKVPEDFEGRSLWPLLEGKAAEHYDAAVTNHGLWSAQRAMRTSEWSLVRTVEPGMLDPRPAFELYNRAEDPGESQDVAADHPDLFEEMQNRYFRWMEEHLGQNPDPLRVVVQSGRGAWVNVKARYERHLTTQAAPVTPKDRARIDDEPGEASKRLTSR